MRKLKQQLQYLLVAIALAGSQQQSGAATNHLQNVVQRFTCGSGATSVFAPVPTDNTRPPFKAPFSFGNGNNTIDPIDGSILSIVATGSGAGGCVIYHLPSGLTHAPFRHIEFFYLQSSSDAEEHTTIVFEFFDHHGTFFVFKNLEHDFIDPFNETQDGVPNGWTRAFADPSFFGPRVAQGAALEGMSFFTSGPGNEGRLTMKFGNVSVTSTHQFDSPATLVNTDAGCAGENPQNFP